MPWGRWRQPLHGSGPTDAPVRPVLRATAENFAAGATAFSEITRAGIASGHFTEEDLD